jgi:quercetin dioxygenase-like cupin family protein
MNKEKNNNLAGKALELTGLISYQKDAVVSKTVIRKKTGTVTIFAFEKGQGLSEHTAPFDAMVFIPDGKARITIAGKARIVTKGEFIILPANKPHALKAIEKFKMLLIMIKS